MMNASGPSLADIAAVTDGNRNNSGWGDGNGWWVLIMLPWASNGTAYNGCQNFCG